MHVVGGIVVLLLSLLAWGGQALSWLAPDVAVKLSLMEHEDTVEPAYWVDGRGEALTDVLTLWTMVVAAVLLLTRHTAWPYFGLVGGGMYLYFGVRGILTRLEMSRRGFRIGAPSSVKLGFGALGVWGLMGLCVAIASVLSLSAS